MPDGDKIRKTGEYTSEEGSFRTVGDMVEFQVPGPYYKASKKELEPVVTKSMFIRAFSACTLLDWRELPNIGISRFYVSFVLRAP
jgi:hypothetical protein